MTQRTGYSVDPSFDGLSLADLTGIMLTLPRVRLTASPFSEAVYDEIAARCLDIYDAWAKTHDASGASIAPDPLPPSVPPPPTQTQTHTQTSTQPTPQTSTPQPPPPPPPPPPKD